MFSTQAKQSSIANKVLDRRHTGIVTADRADSIQLDDVLCCWDQLADRPEWLHIANRNHSIDSMLDIRSCKAALQMIGAL